MNGRRQKQDIFLKVKELLKNNLRFFLFFSLAALLLRLIFMIRFPGVVEDSFLYGDIAKNWLEHGIYGLSGADEISPTYIRLPGYPAFLAVIFSIFGLEHYRAVLVVQMFVDLGTCFLTAALTLRLLTAKHAKLAFALAALCPFLADYSAAALTETLEVFFTTLAFSLALRAGEEGGSLRNWAGSGAAAAMATLLRPDGALVIVAIEFYLASRLWSQENSAAPDRRRLLLAAAVVAGLPLLCLAPWAWRNWAVFHRVQPLAPRYVNEENEFVPRGFNRWVRTWMADYTSVEEIYWQMPGNAIDAGKLPSRAFDSTSEEAETRALINDYNHLLHVSPELDESFEALAGRRIRHHPLRYYLGLPLTRIADMWLRPRTEMLPADSRWWEFNDEPRWSVVALSLGAINLFYIAAAVGGMYWLRLPATGLLVCFVLLRSGFLGTLENPEPRYTLEMYPAVIMWAAAGLRGRKI